MRAGEEHRLLRHDAEGSAKFVGGEMADVLAVERDMAFHRLVEAEHQLGERALAATRRAHDHGEVAGLEGEFELFVEPGGMLGVAE